MVELDYTQIHLIVLTILGPILATGIIAWIKTKTKCLSKIDKRSFRQSKALILLAEQIDNQTNHAHPKDQESNLATTMKDQLTDEKGNL